MIQSKLALLVGLVSMGSTVAMPACAVDLSPVNISLGPGGASLAHKNLKARSINTKTALLIGGVIYLLSALLPRRHFTGEMDRASGHEDGSGMAVGNPQLRVGYHLKF